MSPHVRFVYWRFSQIVLRLTGKLGAPGAWHEAIFSSIVADKVSQARTDIQIAACLQRLRHLSPAERSRVIVALGADHDWSCIDEAVLRSLGDTLQRALPTILALAMLMLGACAASDRNDATCAFSTTARYTLTVVDAPNVAPMTGTLACLTDQDTGDDCMQIVPKCDGETITVSSPRYPDRLYTYTIVRSDASGIVAHFEDVSAHAGYDVKLQEI